MSLVCMRLIVPKSHNRRPLIFHFFCLVDILLSEISSRNSWYIDHDDDDDDDDMCVCVYVREEVQKSLVTSVKRHVDL